MGEEYTDEEPNLLNAFQLTWALMLSDNEYRFKTRMGWFAYFVFTIFLVVIMLNLLISVVGDIYDRV